MKHNTNEICCNVQLWKVDWLTVWYKFELLNFRKQCGNMFNVLRNVFSEICSHK